MTIEIAVIGLLNEKNQCKILYAIFLIIYTCSWIKTNTKVKYLREVVVNYIWFPSPYTHSTYISIYTDFVTYKKI